MDAILIYLICFGVGLLFTLLSALFGEVFGGHDADGVGTGGHAEAGFDHTGMPGMSIFSPTVMAAFLTAFGGFGMIFSKFEPTKNPWVSGPLSALCGLAVAGAVFVMFNRIFKKTQSSSEGKVAALLGTDATITSPIPEQGVGEIAYVQGGSRYSAPARTESGQAIPAGRTVRITRIVGTQFFVEQV
jgi:membrane protein implicated in regulation of membrane protease activity